MCKTVCFFFNNLPLFVPQDFRSWKMLLIKNFLSNVSRISWDVIFSKKQFILTFISGSQGEEVQNVDKEILFYRVLTLVN